MTDGASEPNFWTWSLKQYEAEGAAPLLLRLQDDFGYNVNLLLWCLWCAERFEAIPHAIVEKAADAGKNWNRAVTAPLRAARRGLKNPPAEAQEEAAGLRESVKKMELHAEKIEQDMLNRIAIAELAPLDAAGDASARARDNLRAYAATHGAGEAGARPLLDRLAVSPGRSA